MPLPKAGERQEHRYFIVWSLDTACLSACASRNTRAPCYAKDRGGAPDKRPVWAICASVSSSNPWKLTAPVLVSSRYQLEGVTHSLELPDNFEGYSWGLCPLHKRPTSSSSQCICYLSGFWCKSRFLLFRSSLGVQLICKKIAHTANLQSGKSWHLSVHGKPSPRQAVGIPFTTKNFLLVFCRPCHSLPPSLDGLWSAPALILVIYDTFALRISHRWVVDFLGGRVPYLACLFKIHAWCSSAWALSPSLYPYAGTVSSSVIDAHLAVTMFGCQ